jgi:hypothetical protein
MRQTFIMLETSQLKMQVTLDVVGICAECRVGVQHMQITSKGDQKINKIIKT